MLEKFEEVHREARETRANLFRHRENNIFVGAAKWARTVMRDERLQNYLSANQIKWQFNLSRAPWWGGQFEKIIVLVKSALHKSIGNGMLSWKELQEVLLDVEITLNNRPLSYHEDDPPLPVLTPSSMLFVNSNVLPELQPHRVERANLRKRAKHLLKCKEAVWRRWSTYAAFARGTVPKQPFREMHLLSVTL